MIIADSFNLTLSTPTNPSPTRFLDTTGEANLVINLMFLQYGSSKLNQHSICPDHHLSLDHAPLTINIPIVDNFINNSKLSIAPNSEQEMAFVKDLIAIFKNIETSNITNKDNLEDIVNHLGTSINWAWTKNAKQLRISRHSKQWWTKECSKSLNNYRTTRSCEDWKRFKNVMKNTKQSFFDSNIQEVANKSCSPWELMNWINRCKLPATEAIKFNSQPCITPDSLWGALHNMFNHTINCQVNVDILNEIENKSTSLWEPFSKLEFRNVISKCNNSSAPGPDKITWRHLKHVLKQEECLLNIINIANVCINLGHWPNYFKCSSIVIIPKPNKPKYDHLKAFCPIVLLNTLGKLIEKVIMERLQFIVANNNFIHPSQLGGFKFKFTLDAGVALTYIVCSGWAKNKSTSVLAFNIAQFFPSLNHHLLTIILEKVGLEPKVASFFMDYLVKRKTNYNWNELSFPIFKVNVGVGQGSALSPILSALYLLPFLYILEKCLKNLKIPISFISFVDDGLIIAQNKSIVTLNSQLFCSYNILSKLLDKFSLIVEYSKTNIFHFNRSHGVFNPPLLDLSAIRGPILKPKDSWKYLGFIFDWKLNFHQHINFYLNKAISMVKYMKLLGNLSRGINPIQKRLLYRCCILPITLYRFQLWFYNKVPLSYYMKILGKMQRRATIWILGTFKISPSEGIKAIAGLVPIKYHLQKLVGRSQLCYKMRVWTDFG